jgi:hypothetical protein
MKHGISCTVPEVRDNLHVEVAIIAKSHKAPLGLLEMEGDFEVLFDWQGIMYYEFIPAGATVNKRYKDVLAHLLEAI